MYGPKGVGALYVRRSKPRVRLTAQMDGGGHERGMRSGTLNVPGIVGFGRGRGDRCIEWRRGERSRVGRCATASATSSSASSTSSTSTAPGARAALPGNLNVSFAYVEGEGLMMAIKDVAVSSGSACTSASLEPSYVLRALGVDEELAHTSIRFGLGRFTTDEEVDYVGDLVIEQGEEAPRPVAAL
jgi:cysteine desulfurase